MTDNLKIKVKIKKSLSTLWIIPSKDLNALTETLDWMSKEALNDVLSILSDAKKKQDDILTKLIEKDKDFGKKLKKFTQKQYMKVIGKIEGEEHESAEKYITDI